MRALAAPLKRPIGASAVFVGLLFAGALALFDLPLGLAPDLEVPRITISLTWRNASPATMEALVTSRVESEAMTLPDVVEMTSVSGTGWGRVDVSFERGTAMDVAEVVLRERLSALREQLPKDLGAPVLERSVPRELDPGSFFVFQASGDRTPEALRQLLEDQVMPRLTSVAGVSGGEVYGGSRPEMRVAVDPAAVVRGAASLGEVTNVLAGVAREKSIGSMRRDGYRQAVAMSGLAARESALDEATIRKGRLLGDIADVRDTWSSPRSLARLDGRPAIQGVLERESGTNVLTVARDVRDALEEVKPSLPQDVSLRVIGDESESIRREIRRLAERAGLSLVLIFVVLTFIRRSVRSAFVVWGAVLFSSLSTFLLFRTAGLGINLVTLSGLALAFGMAVDNAIVILESIDLRVRRPRDLLRTLAATREVLFPILAATATTAVVVMPFLYFEGDLRDTYLPFVLAVVLSLVASLAVALVWTPLAGAWAHGSTRRRTGGPVRDTDRHFGVPSRLFRRLLSGTLRRPWLPACLSIAFLGGGLWIFENQVYRGSIFSSEPNTDLRVAVAFPPGTETERTNRLIESFEAAVLSHDLYEEGFLERVESFVVDERGLLSVRFTPAAALTPAPSVLQDVLSVRAAAVSGAEINVSGQGPGFSRGGAMVSPTYRLRVLGPDYETLGELAEGLGALLSRTPRVRDIDTNASGIFVEDASELVLVPDRRRMEALGFEMEPLVRQIEPALSNELGSLEWVRPEGEITARLRFGDKSEFEDWQLLTLPVRNELGVSVPLGELFDLVERDVPTEIHRRDQRYERAITFEYRGPRRVGDRYVRAVVENTELPAGYTLEDGLGFFLTEKDETAIHRAIVFACLLVYLVAAALFESFLLPFVALLSLPLSFGAIPYVFWLLDEPFDRTAYVGLILLAGIAINSALLYVYRAGRLRARGVEPLEAARRAAFERARPIALTTVTSVAGLVPLLWSAPGTGETWRALALSATVGLVASSLFTLFVVPCFFALLTRRSRKPREIHAPLVAKGEALS